MARPRRSRRVCSEPAYGSFFPEGIPHAGEVMLTLDEYEALRLIDLEKLTHARCAVQMDISRTTVTEIYESARGKLADALVNGKVLFIAGGDYRLCDGSALVSGCCHKHCRKFGKVAEKAVIDEKGAKEMRIAVTYENGQIFQHFGHTAQFKVYDVEDGNIVKEQIMDTNGSGHGALAGLLADVKADALICGGIGGGAQMALAEAGIKLYGGVSGAADAAVAAFLAGNLDYNPDVHCSHHDNGHHGHGHCGEDKHGCSGNGGSCH